MPRIATHCRGYYQHACGVRLTEANRHPQYRGLCRECGRRYKAANYYQRRGRDVPQRVHDGNIRKCGNRYWRDPRENEPVALNEARRPLRFGAFAVVDMPGAVLLRVTQRVGCTDTTIEVTEVLDEPAIADLVAWLAAACQRKGIVPPESAGSTG